jgi:hypothetical protein
MNIVHSPRSVMAILIAVLVVFCCWSPVIQKTAEEQVDVGLKRALATFASARLLNAGISVMRGTEVDVQPGGIGVTLSVGRVLDPIDELIEQFSTLMLFASVSFGIQKVLLMIGGTKLLSAVVTGVIILWAALSIAGKSRSLLTKFVVLLLLFRFAVPVSTLGSELVFQNFLQAEYVEAQQHIGATSLSLSKATPPPPAITQPAAEPGWFDRMKEKIGSVVDASKPDIEGIKKSVEGLPAHVIRIIVSFVMQTLILPVGFLWLLVVAGRAIVRRPETIFSGTRS